MTHYRRQNIDLRRWLVDGSEMEGKDQKGEFLVFTLADAQLFLDILIDNAFVQGFKLLFQQVTGIPMGISPGVYLANFYLFTFELQFLTQLASIIVEHPPVEGVKDEIGLDLLHPSPALQQELHNGRPCYRKGHLARLVWRAFRFTSRFVDDLQSIVNRFIGSLMYNDMTIAGGLIRGIYGRDCPWEDTLIHDMTRVPFMDLLQVFFQRGLVMVGTTRLYDKRREHTFDGLDYVQYSHATTCLSSQCLHNILIGQLCRFSLLIMDKDNFISEVAILLQKLLHQGFKLQPLLARYKRFLKHHPQLYGGVGWPELFQGPTMHIQH